MQNDRKTEMKKERKFLMLFAVLFCFFGFFIFAADSQVSKLGGECSTCHNEVALSFSKSPHATKFFSNITDQGCESCHGSGKEHIEGSGDVTKIFSFSKSSNKEKINETCLSCHKKESVIYFTGSKHETRNIACTDCHKVHSPESSKSLLKEENEVSLCLICHKEKRSQTLKSSRHPIKEGKMTCSNCHNPHGSMTEKLISKDSINEKCYSCHADKRGPFLYEHFPVVEDCTNCHDPHGSNHQGLLKARTPFLCQRCHSEPRHPGSLYDESNKNHRAIYNRSCLNCHSNIHGSNNPSGKTFLR